MAAVIAGAAAWRCVVKRGTVCRAPQVEKCAGEQVVSGSNWWRAEPRQQVEPTLLALRQRPQRAGTARHRSRVAVEYSVNVGNVWKLGEGGGVCVCFILPVKYACQCMGGGR